MGLLNFLVGNPSDKQIEAYATILRTTVEDDLPPNLIETKKKALEGDADALYKIALHYKTVWSSLDDAGYAGKTKDVKAFYAAHNKVYLDFIYKAADLGSSGAIAYRKKNFKY